MQHSYQLVHQEANIERSLWIVVKFIHRWKDCNNNIQLLRGMMDVTLRRLCHGSIDERAELRMEELGQTSNFPAGSFLNAGVFWRTLCRSRFFEDEDYCPSFSILLQCEELV